MAHDPKTPPSLLRKFRIKTYENGCFRSTLSHDGTQFVTYSGPWHQNAANQYEDFQMVLWDAEHGTRVRTFAHSFDHQVTDMCIDHDGIRLATFGGPFVQVWDIDSDNELGRVELCGNKSGVFLNDGTLLAHSGVGSVINYDLESNREIFRLEVAGNLFAISPDNALLLAPSGRKATLWDTSKGTRLATIEHDSRLVSALDFSADGTKFLVQCGKTMVFDTATREMLCDIPFVCPMNGFTGFSPDGRFIAGYARGQWITFDAETGQQIAAFNGLDITFRDVMHAQDVKTPDDRWLIYGGREVWEFPLA